MQQTNIKDSFRKEAIYMIRVLHVFKTYYPYTYGGVENVIKSICAHSSRQDIYSEILLCGPEDKVYSYEGVKVTALRSAFKISNNPISLRFIKNFIYISAHFNVIHFHYPFIMNELLSCFQQKIKTPYIITYHSDVIRKGIVQSLYMRFSNRFLKRAKFVIFTSKNYSEISYTKNMDITREIIPLTVSSEKQSTKSLPSERVRQLSGGFILFVGNLRRYKGLKTLLEAARYSSRTFVVAGTGEDEKLLKFLSYTYKLENVIFLGEVTEADKYDLLKKCHFLCLPSDRKSEAFGVILLEAFSVGKCVLTSDLNTGVAFVNTHDDTGRVFKQGNYEDMNKQIEYLYENPLDYARYCKNALNASITKFSPANMDTYVKIYRSLSDR